MCSVQCTVATSVGCIPADGLSHEGRRRGSCCNWPAALLKRRVRLTQSARVVWGRHAATAVQGMLSPWFGFAAAHVCHLPVKQLPVLPGAMSVFCNCLCSGLARPRAPALQCLDVFPGAGELPRRLVLSLCVGWDGTCCARGGCRAGLPLLHWWHAVWFDVCVVSSLAARIAP